MGFVTLCFATLLFLFIFQYRLTHATYENYLRLSNLSQSQNVSKEIKDIAHDFSRLRKNFQIVNIFGNNPFVSHEKIATADAIIDGGTRIAFGMEKGYHLASELVEAFRDTQEITPLLEKRRRTIESISKHFHKAHDAYESIDSSSLDDLRLEAIFEEKRMQLQQASRVLASITDNYELFLNTL